MSLGNDTVRPVFDRSQQIPFRGRILSGKIGQLFIRMPEGQIPADPVHILYNQILHLVKTRRADNAAALLQFFLVNTNRTHLPLLM